MSLRQKVYNQANQVAASIDHGECFYSQHELDELLTELDELKRLSIAYFEENKKELEEDSE